MLQIKLFAAALVVAAVYFFRDWWRNDKAEAGAPFVEMDAQCC
jgi:hypothetical protein